MHMRFQIPRIQAFWPLEYRRINKFCISLIIGAIIGFTAGRLVESFHYGDTKQSYQAQIQELMQQVSECGHAMDNPELSSATKPSHSLKADGILAINY